MTDPVLTAQIDLIKSFKPTTPGPQNCIDFSLGDSGLGVRCILTFDPKHGWTLSTSIGKIHAAVYLPMLLASWTEPLRKSASSCTGEILALFDIDELSKSVKHGKTVILLMFKTNVVH